MLDRLPLRAVAGAATLAIGMLCATPIGAQESDQITINGNPVDVEPAPIVQAGRVFVPLRGVFEQLGASVVYDDGEIDATQGSTDVSLHIGSTQATVNGVETDLDVAPFIVGESAYIPLRFVSQALGASVSYDDADRIVAISTPYAVQSEASDPPNFSEAGYDVNQAPPPLPAYEQPPVPQPNDIWQPGCWAWSQGGYYWVPGAWVQPPAPELVWTPGYWSWRLDSFGWHPGYWANQVGYYGGVNYGGGYNGQGYDGGRWQDGAFHYNRAVTNVNDVTNTTIVKNTYVNNTTIVNNYTTVDRRSYNGGPNGVVAQPTVEQLAVARETHFPDTAVQRENARVASQDRRLLASVNAGRPPVTVVTRPLTPENRPADFAPVTSADRAAARALVVRPKPAAVRPPAAVHPKYVAPAERPNAVAPVARPRYAAPAARPKDVAPAERPKYVAPPAKPEHVVAPVARPKYVAPVERPKYVAPVERPKDVAPAARPERAAPTARPQYVAPPARPERPAPAERPRYVAPAARPNAIVRPVAPPAPRPATAAHRPAHQAPQPQPQRERSAPPAHEPQ